MARKTVLPTYGLHKATGQARCYVNGRSVYLGPYGSDESRLRFAEVVAKLEGGPKIDPIATKMKAIDDCGPAVAQLVITFMDHAEGCYLKPDGTQTDEVHCLRSLAAVLESGSSLSRLPVEKSLKDHRKRCYLHAIVVTHRIQFLRKSPIVASRTLT